LQIDREMKKSSVLILVVLVLTSLFSKIYGVNSSVDIPTEFGSNAETNDLWSRSNITLPTVQNLTIVPTNFSVVELSTLINPTSSVIDVVKGFEPVRRFNSEFNSTLVRKAYVGNCSLRRIDDELLLFLNASSEYEAAITRYKLYFTNPIQISKSNLISLALSTSSTYNSSEAYIGVSLILRDPQGKNHYVSVQVSDRYSEDSFILSKWFLGWTVDLSKECPEYPHYDMMYGSTSGPWFIQLPLSDSFEALNLSSAWLDGLLIGGEIFSKPPFDLGEIAEVNARFHYVFVHEQPFTINEEIVNSTRMVFPFSSSLCFSGIPGESVNVIVEGSLKPIYTKEERQENETVYIRETLFNLSATSESEISVQGNLKIGVLTKAVKECTITLNNRTMVDLTDSLLRSNTLIYRFPPNVILLKVHLVLHRFNAWFFKLSVFQPSEMTKKGIVEEYFSPNSNEGTININSSENFPPNLAISSGNLGISEIRVNGTKKPLQSLLILNEERYWLILNVIPEENRSVYTVKYVVSDEPLIHNVMTTPFTIYIGGHIFEVYTPFNIEGQKGILIPLTIRTYTPKTYTLRIEYDPSMIEADTDEIMVYASRYHYEYFMLKPLRVGHTTIGLEIMDPTTMDVIFSSSFSVNIKSSVPTQMIIYYLLGIAVFSLVYLFNKKRLIDWISHLRH